LVFCVLLVIVCFATLTATHSVEKMGYQSYLGGFLCMKEVFSPWFISSLTVRLLAVWNELL